MIDNIEKIIQEARKHSATDAERIERLVKISEGIHYPEDVREKAKEYVIRMSQENKVRYKLEITPDYKFVWVAEPINKNLADIPPIDNKIMGHNLLTRRKFFSMTQKEVGDKIGCSRQAYQKYENGSRSVPIDLLAKLAVLFKTTIDQLVREPKGLKDMPQYKPYAIVDKNIHFVEMYPPDIMDGVVVVGEPLTLPKRNRITYETLYRMFDGTHGWDCIGYATAENGEQVLIIYPIRRPAAIEDVIKERKARDFAVLHSLSENLHIDTVNPKGPWPQVWRCEKCPSFKLRYECKQFIKKVESENQ